MCGRGRFRCDLAMIVLQFGCGCGLNGGDGGVVGGDRVAVGV